MPTSYSCNFDQLLETIYDGGRVITFEVIEFPPAITIIYKEVRRYSDKIIFNINITNNKKHATIPPLQKIQEVRQPQEARG